MVEKKWINLSRTTNQKKQDPYYYNYYDFILSSPFLIPVSYRLLYINFYV